jgi:hypothetical protein
MHKHKLKAGVVEDGAGAPENGATDAALAAVACPPLCGLSQKISGVSDERKLHTF